eukprot:3797236-Amphidinium_carterae.1
MDILGTAGSGAISSGDSFGTCSKESCTQESVSHCVDSLPAFQLAFACAFVLNAPIAPHTHENK